MRTAPLLAILLLGCGLVNALAASEAEQRREDIRSQLTRMTAAAELSTAFNLIHELVEPSVASIHINQSLLQLNRVSGSIEKREVEIGEGSGFVVASDASVSYLMTNAHVVLQTNRNQEFIRDEAGAPLWQGTIRVSLSDQRVIEAEPVGADTKTDLAVLRIPIGSLPVVTWGDSDAARVGDWVLALGFPLGVGYSASAGIISAKARSTGIYRNEGGYESFIQTDAAINPGNSGGPMLNLRGEVIGVNANILSRTGVSIGLGFAIPSNLAQRVAEDLIADGRVSRPMIGVQMTAVDPALAEERQLANRRAVAIERVMPGSPAARAGLLGGDIVTAVEGRSVFGIEQFRTRIASARIGEELRFTVWRNGAEEELTLIPMSWEDYANLAGGLASPREAVEWPRFGLRLTTDEFRGLVVETVVRDSVAHRAGLRAGHRILRIGGIGPVNQLEGLSRLDGSSELTLEIYRDRQILLLRLRP